jgi:trimeric autotransporter adhesin
MASILSKIGIVTGQLVEPQHVTQSIDAFTGIKAYDISLSGSFNMTGSIIGQPGTINPLTASFAQTASYVTGSIFAGANSVSSASYACSASYAPGGGVTQIVAGTNINLGDPSGIGIVTINATPGGSGDGFPFTGSSAQITGSLGVTGSINNLLIGTGKGNVLTNISIGATTAFNTSNIGTHNTAIGCTALVGNTSGSHNTAIGLNALRVNTTGSYNTAIGYRSLENNTLGFHNTAIGYATLCCNKIGRYNTAIGKSTLISNTSGSHNTAIGNAALQLNTSGSFNTAIGDLALQCNTTGSHNIAIGRATLLNNSGSNNTAIGQCALCCNTIGSNNIAFGQNAGSFLSGSSSNNITIGFGSGPSTNTEENDKLYIASGSGVPLIKGDFAAKTVDISGSLAVTGSITGSLCGTATTITTIPALTGHVTSSGTTNATTIANGVVTNAMLAGSIENIKLAQITTANCVANSATTATNVNNASTIVARDADGNFSAGTITANLTGNATTVTTIPALTGHVTSSGTTNATTIANEAVTNAMLAGSIENIKLAQITTANCVANSATTATNVNNASTIVCRDASKNFCANIITACLNGNASTVTTIPALTGHVTSSGTTNATTIANGVVTNAMLAGSIENIKLAQITTANCVANSATTATNLNNANAIVARDASKNFCANIITACLNGNASTVTTIPALTGDVCSGGTNNLVTTIANEAVTNDMLAGSIPNSKLATPTNLNTANAIVTRDGNGNFCANTISANLYGNATTATGLFCALTGDVSSGGTNKLVTTIGPGKVTNAMLAGGITNDKFTSVCSLNLQNTIVCRDANGCFKISAITFQPNATTPSPQIGSLKVYCCYDDCCPDICF